MDNQMKEQVIYPKDLLFAALYRWKTAVILGLILAIVLGGLQLLKGQNNGNSTDIAAYEQALNDYEIQKAPVQKAVDYWKKEVENHQAYLQESLYVSLDPYAHYRGTIQLYVSTDYQIQPDKTYQTPDMQAYLLAAYQTILNQDATVAVLAQTAGLSWRLFREIYSIFTNPSTGILAIQIRHNDPAMMDTLMVAVDAQIAQAQQTLASMGTHKLITLEHSSNLVVDTAVSEHIRGSLNHLQYLQESLAQAEADLSALVPPAEPQASSPSPKKAIVFGVLGFVAGFILVAICAWFVHMESDKVYSARLLRLRTGVKVLGTLTVTHFGLIDRCIRKWEGRDLTDPAQKAALLASDIRNRFPAGKLLLTGTGAPEDRALLVDALAAAGIQVADCGSILTSAEAVEALKNVDSVVLAEKCAAATCTDIFNEIQIVADYDKAFLGCVVLNG